MPEMQCNLDITTRVLLGHIQDHLAQNGISGYVVGGFLRDLVLGRPERDIDVALGGNAPDIGSSLARELDAKLVPLDETNGVVRLILLRPEDNNRQIDLSTIHGEITSDLRRRDLTIDALACDLAIPIWNQSGPLTLELIDPLGGLMDIKDRLVRATGDDVFKQDALRLMRAVRFAAELGFSIDCNTESLIRRDAFLLQQVAGERVREELLRLLTLIGTDATLIYMQELDLVTAIIPELAPSVGLKQHSDHQWDVFKHSAHSVAAFDFLLRRCQWPHSNPSVLDDVPWNESLSTYFNTTISHTSTRRELIKLAALLHDIAKPQTRTVAPNGKLCFYGHPQEGAPIVEKIMERLRFSTKENKLVTSIVRHHLRPVQISGDDAMPSRRAVYRMLRDMGDAAPATLYFSLADHLATRGNKLDLTNWRHHANIVAYALSESENVASITPEPLLNGYDLQHEFGLIPGVRLGKIMIELNEAQATGEITSKEEARQYTARLIETI